MYGGVIFLLLFGTAALQTTTLGCWRDRRYSRAIPTLEDQGMSVLDGYYEVREIPIEKCLQATKSKG